jgi:hypothetical protein
MSPARFKILVVSSTVSQRVHPENSEVVAVHSLVVEFGSRNEAIMAMGNIRAARGAADVVYVDAIPLNFKEKDE